MKILPGKRAALAATILWILLLGTYMQIRRDERVLETSLLRFRVIANSDSEQDQSLKLKVRDRVLSYCHEQLLAAKSAGQAAAYLEAHKTELAQIARETLKEEGVSYAVRISLGTDLFPTREYGNIRLPAGRYRTLRIELGKSAGHNWWCVMFPPVCYSLEDETLPEDLEESLEETLGPHTNELIHYEEEGTAVKFRFKLIEWWHDLERYFRG